MWRHHCCSRKEVLSVSWGRTGCAVVFCFSMRTTPSLLCWAAGHCSYVQPKMLRLKLTHCYLFSCLNLLCDFSRSSFILSSPTHVSLCHKTSLSFLFLYKCLQYLMEVKKAQSSLESTYKQLDYVSWLLKCVDWSKWPLMLFLAKCNRVVVFFPLNLFVCLTVIAKYHGFLEGFFRNFF